MDSKGIKEILAHQLDISRPEADTMLKKILHVFKDQLAEDNSFEIPDFGTFSIRKRDERRSYNPTQEQYVVLPPKKVVYFTPSRKLKQIVGEPENTNE